MKIGIFSTCEVPGGSEFRCAELASGIALYTSHQSFLLCEGLIHPKILKKVDEAVSLRLNVLKEQDKVEILYEMDTIIVVNTNSEVFTDVEYWRGNTDRHNSIVDLTRIRSFVFLFNFILHPAMRLPSLLGQVDSIKIINANSRFFHAISSMDMYKEIRHLPRLVLASPIDPSSVSTSKTASSRIRIGQHSIPWMDKFNEEIGTLVEQINNKYSDRTSWHFMGIPERESRLITQYPNVTIREAFAIPISDFLRETDIFLFYPSWKRSEPWCRSVAEALMSGCPVVATATKGGNRDQIIHGNNGYLCRNLDDFVKYLSGMIEQPELIQALGKNASLYSRFFSTKYVVRKLMEFIQ